MASAFSGEVLFRRAEEKIRPEKNTGSAVHSVVSALQSAKTGGSLDVDHALNIGEEGARLDAIKCLRESDKQSVGGKAVSHGKGQHQRTARLQQPARALKAFPSVDIIVQPNGGKARQQRGGVPKSEYDDVIFAAGVVNECARVIHIDAHLGRRVRLLRVVLPSQIQNHRITFHGVHLPAAMAKGSGYVVSCARAHHQNRFRLGYKTIWEFIIIAYRVAGLLGLTPARIVAKG